MQCGYDASAYALCELSVSMRPWHGRSDCIESLERWLHSKLYQKDKMYSMHRMSATTTVLSVVWWCMYGYVTVALLIHLISYTYNTFYIYIYIYYIHVIVCHTCKEDDRGQGFWRDGHAWWCVQVSHEEPVRRSRIVPIHNLPLCCTFNDTAGHLQGIIRIIVTSFLKGLSGYVHTDRPASSWVSSLYAFW